jgi:AcrR family transcriptional regulator
MFPHPMERPPGNKRTREAHQLPAGRHGLPRTFVVRNQRERILSAVADVTSVAGYGRMTVEDIIATAGVSRRTFYDNFDSKEHAFLEAYDEAVSQLMEHVLVAFAAGEGFADRTRRCITAIVRFLASEPAFADMCVIEALAAGPAAIERRSAAFGGLVALFDESVRQLEDRLDPPPVTTELVLGGVNEVVFSRLVGGGVDELFELLPDLVYGTIVPYAGHERAQATYEAMKASPRPEELP